MRDVTELAQDWPAPSAPKPIALIGAGGIVRDAHLPAYARAGLPVASVTDLDAGRAGAVAADFGIPATHSDVAAAVAAHRNEAVYDVAVPPDAIRHVLPLLPDGAAVLIQKPFGPTQKEARHLRGICREKKLTAAMNFQLRFSPMMRAVKDAVDRGWLGDLLEIEVHLNTYTPWDLFPFLIPMERVEIAVHSIHYLDTIRAIAGTPKGVFARTMGDPRAPEFRQTRTTAVLDYDGPLRAVMTLNHNHRCGRKFQSCWFRFEGTQGAMMVKLGVLYDYPNGEADELWFCENGGEWAQVPLAGSWFIESFMGPMRNLQRVAAGEDAALYSGIEDAYRTMALAEACFASAAKPAEPLVLD